MPHPVPAPWSPCFLQMGRGHRPEFSVLPLSEEVVEGKRVTQGRKRFGVEKKEAEVLKGV